MRDQELSLAGGQMGNALGPRQLLETCWLDWVQLEGVPLD